VIIIKSHQICSSNNNKQQQEQTWTFDVYRSDTTEIVKSSKGVKELSSKQIIFRFRSGIKALSIHI